MKPSVRLLLVLPSLVTTLHAAVPLTVNYQGIVYDSAGAAIGASAAVNRKVIFRLYDASTAGNKLWTEEQTVTIYKGEFSVVLGNGTTATGTASTEIRPALDTVFTGSTTTRYLEVMVDNGDGSITAADTPISPRQLITTTFYAFHAQVAEAIASSTDLTINPPSGSGTATNYGLGWYGTARLWAGTTAVDGPVLYGNAGGALGSNASGTKNTALLWNAAGQVGIGATGTFTTNSKLTLQGDDNNTAARQLIIRGQTDSNEAVYLGFDTTNNRATLQSYTSASAATGGSLLLNPSGGNVSIGTTSPVAKLTVEGSISATGTGGYTFGTGGDTDGGLFSPADGTLQFRTNGNEKVRIDSNGRVGIGTTNPNTALDVLGALSTSGMTYMAHDMAIYGTNTAGGAQEACFWPRSGNATYLNYGSNGFNIRNSSFALKMFMNNDGKVGIATNNPINMLSVEGAGGSVAATTSTAIAHFGYDPGMYFGTYEGTGQYGGWLQVMRPSDQLPFPLSINPNGGKVAIGTKNPYNQLHLFGANGTSAPAHQNSASIYLQDSNSTSGSGGALLFGAMSTNATDNGGMFAGIKAHATNVTGVQTLGDLAFYTRRLGTDGSLTESMRIMGSGNVGIGTTSPRCPLEILGSKSITYTGDDYSTGSGWINKSAPGSETQNVSIYASNYVACQTIQVFSDQRVKSDIHLTDNKSDLQTLMGIEISDYKYKDGRKFGAKPQKKVIAQQVEKVYPQAVAASTDVVPDIFKKATAKAGWVSLVTDLKVGERVKLINGTEQSVHEVLEVRDGAFRTDYQVDTDKLFVYGREVNDFRTVDYDAIAMLNVSATQQIKKEQDLELKVLKEQNAALQLKLAAEQKVVSAQEARIAALEAQDQTLEAKHVAQLAEQNAKLAALERLISRQLNGQPPVAVNNVLPKRAE